MMYEEFNRIAGQVSDLAMYQREIEPTYMMFENVTKQEMAAMYWGFKKDAYGLWVALNDLYREMFFLAPAIKGLRGCGLTGRADALEQDWENRADDVIEKIKAMHLENCKQFHQGKEVD